MTATHNAFKLSLTSEVRQSIELHGHIEIQYVAVFFRINTAPLKKLTAHYNVRFHSGTISPPAIDLNVTHMYSYRFRTTTFSGYTEVNAGD